MYIVRHCKCVLDFSHWDQRLAIWMGGFGFQSFGGMIAGLGSDRWPQVSGDSQQWGQNLRWWGGQQTPGRKIQICKITCLSLTTHFNPEWLHLVTGHSQRDLAIPSSSASIPISRVLEDTSMLYNSCSLYIWQVNSLVILSQLQLSWAWHIPANIRPPPPLPPSSLQSSCQRRGTWGRYYQVLLQYF